MTYPLLVAALITILLAGFALVTALQIPILVALAPALRSVGALAGLLGVALLVVDGTGATVLAVALGHRGGRTMTA